MIELLLQGALASVIAAGENPPVAVTVPSTTFAAALPADISGETTDGGDVITAYGERPIYGRDRTRTATKTDTAIEKVPQSINVITEDIIADQAMRSLADLVRYVPGVTMGQGEGHRDAPTLRGNATTADFFVDGVRDDVQYYRDLYNAERIEVLKGPNAMVFGRGGGGGVINRVTKWADGDARADLALTYGSFDQYRATVDLSGEAGAVALRLNAVHEDAESYRDFVTLERSGINPTARFAMGPDTELRVGYEWFTDDRTVDRGVPSRLGRPADVGRAAFFGSPEDSFSEIDVSLGTVTLLHAFSPNFTLRSQNVYGDYDKFYQNVFANSAVADNGEVRLQAYFSGTQRQNFFTQNDFVWNGEWGGIRHQVLFGAEWGQQQSANTRSPNSVPGVVTVAAPVFSGPVIFASPLQQDNIADVEVLGVYLQDQISFGDAVDLILGVRYDSFDISINDKRLANIDATASDEFFSPRVGLVVHPMADLSLYGSYQVSFLPQSGDQFAALDPTLTALDPEEFESAEIGLKWSLADDLLLTLAAYQLERSNTRALDPTTNLTVLTGAQESKGVELSLAGAVTPRWDVLASVSVQEVEITSSTTAAPAGRVVPLTPEFSASMWNQFQLSPRLGLGLGVVHQGESFASISNAVTLPAFTRVDAAAYLHVSPRADLQLNLENLTDETYWATAHNDNNITPGGPFNARLTLRLRF